MILMPSGAGAPAFGRDHAITIGRTYDNAHPFPATAVLARVTIPDTLPSPGLPEGAYNPITGTTNKYQPIQNRLVWVVTFTSAQPVDISIGSPFTPVHPIDVTHDNLLLDARTGAFVWGFSSK